MRKTWMLYGATGYSGQLIARHAVSLGHRPVLAGRSRPALERLASELGLDFVVAPLEDPAALAAEVRRVSLVLNAAGPFIETARPVREACLAEGAHYLDITAEVPVLGDSFACDLRARQRGVVVMSGVGFDVVPTDCLARFLKERLPDAQRLELAVAADGLPGAGTARTLLEMLRGGSLCRQDGLLKPAPFSSRPVQFLTGARAAVSLPWGDLVTAFHSTGIPNIRTWVALQGNSARWVGLTAPVFRAMLALAPARAFFRSLSGLLPGPGAEARASARWQVWGRVENARGESQEAWLETAEGYRFTSCAAVFCVEQVFARSPVGAQTPAGAFGADAVLSIPDTVRRLSAEAPPAGPGDVSRAA